MFLRNILNVVVGVTCAKVDSDGFDFIGAS